MTGRDFEGAAATNGALKVCKELSGLLGAYYEKEYQEGTDLMTTSYLVNVPVLDVWETPSQTQRVTQSLFGDPVIIDDEGTSSFVHGRVLDGYLGYVNRSHLIASSRQINEPVVVVKAKSTINKKESANKKVAVTDVFLGTNLIFKEEQTTNVIVTLPDGSEGFINCADVMPVGKPEFAVKKDDIATIALDYAVLLLGAPYLWGGMTCQGIDCSGLVHIAYRTAGVLLPRDADQQHTYSRAISGSPVPGDLAFFATEESDTASHVGLCIGPDRFIHASSRLGGVVVTSLKSPFYKERFLGWHHC